MSHGSVWLPYTQMQTTLAPLKIKATQGWQIVLEDGRELIDSMASWWTACHGYNHPHLLANIQSQLTQCPHIMLGGLMHPQTERLAKRLTQHLGPPFEHVFFSESGSVAVEIAIKMVLQYWQLSKSAAKQRFIYFQHSYHGDTLFTMALCDPNEGMHQRFATLLPTHYFLPLPKTVEQLNEFEAFLFKNANHIAGFIIEPLVQGAGGMKFHSPAMLEKICELAKKYEILIIFDEIFTGFGRTGSLFAYQQTKIVPDIICLSKALTGGMLPLAATIATATIFNAFLSQRTEDALMHGTTFMGNPTSCAAANASLDLFERLPRLKEVQAIEHQLTNELAEANHIPCVKEVRVKGAIGVIELTHTLDTATLNWFKSSFIKDGIWCRPFGNIIYTTPAFTIAPEALSQITGSFKRRLNEWSQQHAL